MRFTTNVLNLILQTLLLLQLQANALPVDQEEQLQKQSVSKGYIKLNGQKSRGSTYKDSLHSNEAAFLEKRATDGSVEMVLQNENTFYRVDLEVGSDRQSLAVLVDTGSSDLWVMNTNNSYCSSNTSKRRVKSKRGRDISDLRNFNAVNKGRDLSTLRNITNEVGDDVSDLSKRDADADADAAGATFYSTTVITAGPGLPTGIGGDTSQTGGATATSASPSEATLDCSQYGTFDPGSSDSFSNNGTAFSISYADGTFADGWWGQDDITFNGVTIENLSLAVADETDSEMGVLGIGFQGLETTYSGSRATRPYQYFNLPVQMVVDNLINKPVYSIYLNDTTSNTASILFGAIDHDKYTGDLHLVPIINSVADYGYNSPIRIEITLSSLILGQTSGNQEITVGSGAATALLDTGTTLTYIPSEMLQSIVNSISDISYSSSAGAYIMNCDTASNYYVTFNLQGVNIQTSLSSYMVSLTTNSGRSSSYCALGLFDSGDEGFILGDSFLRNIYFVVDLQDNQVAFATANLESNAENLEVISDSIPSAASVADYSSTWGNSYTALALGNGSVSSGSSASTRRTTTSTRRSTATGGNSESTSTSSSSGSSSSSNSSAASHKLVNSMIALFTGLLVVGAIVV